MTSQRCFVVAGVCLLAPFALAQTPTTVYNVASTAGYVPQNIYTVDLNNDGVLDLVQDTLNQPNGFTVSIANGDGTYKAPVFYSVPVSNNGLTSTSPTPIATADFNNDGKVDVIVGVNGTDQLEVFLGKGDGTFQTPKTVSAELPSSYFVAESAMVAADYNQDGNADLVMVGSSSGACCTNVVYVLQGNGAGAFSSAHAIYTATGQHVVNGIVSGDFDSDGKPDIALADDIGFQGSFSNTTLAVLYGNGNFTFQKTTAYSAANGARLFISSGDLNGDGKTDLFGLYSGNAQQLAVFYANGSRTFSSYFLNLPSGYFIGDPVYSGNFPPSPLAPVLAMADLNGDTRMDLAVAAENNSNSAVSMIYLLAGTNPGEFTTQISPLPNVGGTMPFWSNPVVIGKNHDNRPSIGINQASAYNATGSSITAQLNGTNGYWGNCLYPKAGNGIGVCSPASGTSNSPVNLSAAATSFGQIRKLELWVDGRKVNEQHNSWGHNAWFAWSGAFAPGAHSATFFAGDVDNRLSRADITFTVPAAKSAGSTTAK